MTRFTRARGQAGNTAGKRGSERTRGRAWIEERLHRRRIAFVITGGVATGLSVAMFALALAAGASPYLATALRLLVALPILYAGYSRYMLVDTLHADRAAVGRLRAELKMMARVAVAIATSMILKLAIEPVLTTWLLAHVGTEAATLSPLAGDFGYGPLATYIVLMAAAPRLQAGAEIAREQLVK